MKLLFSALFFLIFSTLDAQVKSHPVPVILDTDIGPDYDDVGAIAVLHALSDRGEAIPLAVITSNKNELVGLPG